MMVDFRFSGGQFPIQAFLEASKKESKFAGLSKLVKGVESGFTRGLQISETLRGIKEKRARSKAIADFVAPQTKQVQPQQQIPLAPVQGPANQVQGLSQAEQLGRKIGAPPGFITTLAQTEGLGAVSKLLLSAGKTKSFEQRLEEERQLTQVREEVKEPFREESLKRTEKKQIRGEVRKRKVKLDVLAADTDIFIDVDKSIPRGKGFGRFLEGAKSTFAGVRQAEGDIVGTAVATHNALSKRLRVSLVRAAGDVGNINIVEQEAAEKILPGIFDSEEVARTKRTLLKQLSKAVEDRDANAMKAIFKKAGVNFTDKDADAQKLQSGNRFEVIE